MVIHNRLVPCIYELKLHLGQLNLAIDRDSRPIRNKIKKLNIKVRLGIVSFEGIEIRPLL